MGDRMRLTLLSIMWGLVFGWLYLIFLGKASKSKDTFLARHFDKSHPNWAQATEFVLFLLLFFLGTSTFIFIPLKVLTHFGEKIHFQNYILSAVAGIALKIVHLKITKTKL